MSLPRPQPPGHNIQPLSDEHLRVLGSIVTALGHLDLALLGTVRDLVPICAQVVSWCVAVNEVWGRWNQEIHASWVGDQPDESLKRVRYTKTAYRGGLPVEQTGLDDLRRIADDVADRMAELKAMGARLNLRGDQDP